MQNIVLFYEFNVLWKVWPGHVFFGGGVSVPLEEKQRLMQRLTEKRRIFLWSAALWLAVLVWPGFIGSFIFCFHAPQIEMINNEWGMMCGRGRLWRCLCLLLSIWVQMFSLYSMFIVMHLLVCVTQGCAFTLWDLLDAVMRDKLQL